MPGSQWLSWNVHFCCYLWCFLHGSPSWRPRAGTATPGRVSLLGSCSRGKVSGTMRSLPKPFDSGSSMRHRLPLPHRSLRFHCTVSALPAAPHGGATPRYVMNAVRSHLENVSRTSPDAFRQQLLPGVGGSGRSPLESADPQVRRVGSLGRRTAG